MSRNEKYWENGFAILTDDIAPYIGHLNTIYVYSINALPIIFTKVFVGTTIFGLSVFKGFSH